MWKWGMSIDSFEVRPHLFISLNQIWFTLVRNRIGPIANPDIIQNAPGLPKTRSGKIMRRILRKIASDDRNIGDTTTLADPNVVDELFKNKPELS